MLVPEFVLELAGLLAELAELLVELARRLVELAERLAEPVHLFVVAELFAEMSARLR